jgi:XTP/dITP diphosphohydrolase
MDTVRHVEHSIAAGRRAEDVPEELDVSTLGEISEEEWRAYWPTAVVEDAADEVQAVGPAAEESGDTEPAPDRIPEPTPADVPERGPVEVPEPAPVEVPESEPVEAPESEPADAVESESADAPAVANEPAADANEPAADANEPAADANEPAPQDVSTEEALAEVVDDADGVDASVAQQKFTA